MSVKAFTFSFELKASEITYIVEKKDKLHKIIYRPVSVLPFVFKSVDSVCVDHIFRIHHSCQHVILNFIQNCKNAFDSNKVYAALLTDLTCAFDCLPLKLLILNLHAYGLD